MKKYVFSLFGLLVVLLQGCAYLNDSFERPDVKLAGVRQVAAEDGNAGFELRFNVINPNPQPMPVKGVYFSLRLQGLNVVSGVSDQEVNIPAFGESELTVNASIDVLSSLRLVTGVLTNGDKAVTYSFQVRLHTGLWRFPVTVVEEGKIAGGHVLEI